MAAAACLVHLRGEASLDTMGLPATLLPRLRRIVLASALTHDLGKASDHFQQMVRGTRTAPQLVRHEVLSAILVLSEPLSAWLAPLGPDLSLVAAVAAGHHRCFPARAMAAPDAGAGREITVHADHPAFRTTLLLGETFLGLDTPPAFDSSLHFHEDRRHGLHRRTRTLFAGMEPFLAEPPTRTLLAVAKALFIAADVAGSALPRANRTDTWIADALGRRATRGDLEGVAQERLGDHAPRPFQVEIGRSRTPVTLVEAGCGTGKTAAAYLWAAQHAPRQLWFCYPTTGTTTEGYRDYLVAPDIEARLEHGRREVDLDLLDLARDADAHRGRDRLDALRTWQAPVVACTVDTVLGLVQLHRKGVYAWPGLAHAAVVFDEVHAYDERLFGALLRFLEACPGTPVLLMTASLPTHRLQALLALVQRVHGQTLTRIPGPCALESLPRYQAHGGSDPWAAVEDTMARGGKVLWVSNTVGRCLEQAERASEAIVYHSRFRYCDRVVRHAEVIARFREPGPCIALTTQVAELSLDLSADLLVTDLAPVPALIQRLGRLNRRARPGDPVRPFLVLPYDERYPYESGLDEARVWLQVLGGNPLSQRDLVRAWQPTETEAAVPEVHSAWLDGGPVTEPDQLRDSTPGVTVLLPDDAAQVRRGRPSAWAALPMNLPARLRSEVWRWPREHFFPIPPPGSIDYNPRRGGRWQ